LSEDGIQLRRFVDAVINLCSP